MAELAEILKRIAEGSAADTPFTREGFQAFKEETGDFIMRLSQDADLLRKANGSDKISANDVRTSGSRILNKRLSRRINMLNTFGGILMGVSASNLVAVVAADDPVSKSFFLVSIVAGVIGGLLLGYGFWAER